LENRKSAQQECGNDDERGQLRVNKGVRDLPCQATRRLPIVSGLRIVAESAHSLLSWSL
jgi:hypothetical protein